MISYFFVKFIYLAQFSTHTNWIRLDTLHWWRVKRSVQQEQNLLHNFPRFCSHLNHFFSLKLALNYFQRDIFTDKMLVCEFFTRFHAIFIQFNVFFCLVMCKLIVLFFLCFFPYVMIQTHAHTMNVPQTLLYELLWWPILELNFKTHRDVCVYIHWKNKGRENERDKRYFNQIHKQRPTVFCLNVRSVSHSLIIWNATTMKHIQRHRTSVCMEFITDKRTFSTATNLDSSIQNVPLMLKSSWLRMERGQGSGVISRVAIYDTHSRIIT